MAHRLDPLLRPRSIAVLGATERDGTVGRHTVENLLKGGFEGGLYAINPGRQSVLGVPCYSSLAALPEPVEHVMFAIADTRVEAALDEAIAHAKSRQQFGQPIGNYEAIQWMLADMATELAAARMLTYKAAAVKDRGGTNAVEASMAKLAASEAAHKAADKAMQVLASAGYRRGSVVERLFRDVRATEIYQGTSEAQRMIIAANILSSA